MELAGPIDVIDGLLMVTEVGEVALLVDILVTCSLFPAISVVVEILEEVAGPFVVTVDVVIQPLSKINNCYDSNDVCVT